MRPDLIACVVSAAVLASGHVSPPQDPEYVDFVRQAVVWFQEEKGSRWPIIFLDAQHDVAGDPHVQERGAAIRAVASSLGLRVAALRDLRECSVEWREARPPRERIRVRVCSFKEPGTGVLRFGDVTPESSRRRLTFELVASDEGHGQPYALTYRAYFTREGKRQAWTLSEVLLVFET